MKKETMDKLMALPEESRRKVLKAVKKVVEMRKASRSKATPTKKS